MTAVVAAACRYVVEQWDVVRISAYVFDGNVASARVLEKCGFVCEGLQRRRFRKGDEFIDSRLFAVLVGRTFLSGVSVPDGQECPSYWH